MIKYFTFETIELTLTIEEYPKPLWLNAKFLTKVYVLELNNSSYRYLASLLNMRVSDVIQTFVKKGKEEYVTLNYLLSYMDRCCKKEQIKCKLRVFALVVYTIVIFSTIIEIIDSRVIIFYYRMIRKEINLALAILVEILRSLNFYR